METTTTGRVKTKFYWNNYSQPSNQYLTIEFIERHRDKWEDEIADIISEYLFTGQITRADKCRAYTLCSRLGYTFSGLVDEMRDLA